MNRLVVLLTDFGPTEYVGILKGVLLSRAPAATVVDLTNDVSPQCVREGAWLLAQSYRWFPRGTVFLAVVDPTVGTARAAVAVRTRSYFFVGPDNGLLYPAAGEDGVEEAVALAVPTDASCTFHGRDVFAPAAAALAAGEELRSLGVPHGALVPLSLRPDGREGEVVRIDRFGNCITNLLPLPGRGEYRAWIAQGQLPAVLPWRPTYAAAGSESLFVTESSYGTLEIAARQGSAQALVQTVVGARVRLE